MKQTIFTSLVAFVVMALQGNAAQASGSPDPSALSVIIPCTLHADSVEIQLDFKSVINRYLYRYGLTPSRAFTLRLDKCPSQILAGTSLRLTGSESRELPGLLKLAGNSTVSAVVIGLETADGQALPVNGSNALNIALVPSDMTIALHAYLEAEPSAQSSRNIALQNFRATVFLALDYQ